MKERKSYRLTKETVDKINYLSKKLLRSNANVIEFAINKLYEQEKEEEK